MRFFLFGEDPSFDFLLFSGEFTPLVLEVSEAIYSNEGLDGIIGAIIEWSAYGSSSVSLILSKIDARNPPALGSLAGKEGGGLGS